MTPEDEDIREALAETEYRPNRNAVINDLSDVLCRRYGLVALSTREEASRAAIAVVEAEREAHAVRLRRHLISPVREIP